MKTLRAGGFVVCGLAAALTFSPYLCHAQTPSPGTDGADSAQTAPGQVQVLNETLTKTTIVPSTPPSTPAQAQSSSPPAPPQAAPGAPTIPVGAQPTRKQQRQAEKAYLQGAKAIEQQDSGAAFEAFSRAVALDPANQQYLAAKEIAREHFVTQLVQEADKARLAHQPEVSRQKLEQAYALDPKNPIVTQHVGDLADDRKMTVDQVDDKGIDAEPPIELAPANLTKSFHIKGTEQEILRQVLSAYQITPVMDSSVTQKQARFDVDDVDYNQAARLVKMLTNTFFVALDPKRVLVALDTKDNRTRLDRLVLESVYLPGLTTTEMTDLGNVAKNVFEAPVASLQPNRGILTIRAPENRVKALNATLEELLDGRSQVMIEVRLFDINRTRTTNIGVELPSQTTVFNVESELNSVIQGNQAAINQIVSSGLAAPGDYGAILAILIATGQITSGVLTQGFLTFGGGITQFGYNLGTATGNLSLNASSTQALDQINLRVQDQETATFKVGERYPIVTSTYSSGGSSSLSQSGINSAGLSSTLSSLGISSSSLSAQVTIPQIQYEDIGVTLKATPRVQHGEDVALNMDLEVSALAGSTLDGNPILANRKYTATITLKDGTSALVISNLSKQETKAITGIPGLSELPGLRSTTDDSKDINISTLAILVTPYIVRKSHVDVAGREILLPKH
jgi:general secretion pathway protein D